MLIVSCLNQLGQLSHLGQLGQLSDLGQLGQFSQLCVVWLWLSQLGVVSLSLSQIWVGFIVMVGVSLWLSQKNVLKELQSNFF